MTVHTVRVVASSPGRNFIADDDGVLLAESAHQLNAAAATLLDRHWARPSHTILAYLGETLVMGANVGWISGAERWSTDGVMMTYRPPGTCRCYGPRAGRRGHECGGQADRHAGADL